MKKKREVYNWIKGDDFKKKKKKKKKKSEWKKRIKHRNWSQW